MAGGFFVDRICLAKYHWNRPLKSYTFTRLD